MAQELLPTFGANLGEVTLVPGTGGIFAITLNGGTIWDHVRDSGFPEAKMLSGACATQSGRSAIWAMPTGRAERLQAWRQSPRRAITRSAVTDGTPKENPAEAGFFEAI